MHSPRLLRLSAERPVNLVCARQASFPMPRRIRRPFLAARLMLRTWFFDKCFHKFPCPNSSTNSWRAFRSTQFPREGISLWLDAKVFTERTEIFCSRQNRESSSQNGECLGNDGSETISKYRFRWPVLRKAGHAENSSPLSRNRNIHG